MDFTLETKCKNLEAEIAALRKELTEEKHKRDCVETQCGDFEATIRELREQLANC